MSTPPIWLLILLFALGSTVLLFSFLAGRSRPSGEQFTTPTIRRRGILERLQRRLRRAGMPNTSPELFALAAIGLAAGAYLVGWLATTSLVLALAGPPIPLFGLYAYLVWRERNYVARASREIVPFMRRVQSSVSAGRNAQAAMVLALQESPLLGSVLEPVIRRLELNAPFVETLQLSVELLPMRSWEQFVRQMEIHFESGGDLAEILGDAVEQINASIQLQSELRADYGRIAKQQYVLIGIAIGVVPFMHFAMGGLVDILFESLVGWIAFFACIAIMLVGVLFGQLQVRDVEKKLDI